MHQILHNNHLNPSQTDQSEFDANFIFMENAMHLGTLIKQARQKAEVSQIDLSKACGYPYNIVHKWESGIEKIKRTDWAICVKVLGSNLDVDTAQLALATDLIDE